tara:strand:- start:1105 stop:1443 length:339 start_codon:yes stop_codon:yes gene_type:complete
MMISFDDVFETTARSSPRRARQNENEDVAAAATTTTTAVLLLLLLLLLSFLSTKQPRRAFSPLMCVWNNERLKILLNTKEEKRTPLECHLYEYSKNETANDDKSLCRGTIFD